MNHPHDNPALAAFAEHLRVLAARSGHRPDPTDRHAEPCRIRDGAIEVAP